jgi:hypothetical protein
MERMTRMFVSEGEGPALRLEDCPYVFGLDEVTYTSPVYALMKTYDDFAKKVEWALQLSFDAWVERKGEDDVKFVLKENIQQGVYDEFDIFVRRTGTAAVVSLFGESGSEAAWKDDEGLKAYETAVVRRKDLEQGKEDRAGRAWSSPGRSIHSV